MALDRFPSTLSSCLLTVPSALTLGSPAMSSAKSAPRQRSRSLKVPLPRAREGRRLPPGIVRLDYERATGYIVRLAYRLTETGYRPRFRAYFSDTKYGGPRKALAAAVAWLEAVTRTGVAPKPTRGRRSD